MKNCLIIMLGLTIFFGCARIRTDVVPLDDQLMTKPTPGMQFTTGDLDRPYKELAINFYR